MNLNDNKAQILCYLAHNHWIDFIIISENAKYFAHPNLMIIFIVIVANNHDGSSSITWTVLDTYV